MDNVITIQEKVTKTAENEGTEIGESAESFQKNILQMFEKNGVLNDLRAYLRTQIVNVLKNAKSGDTLPCHKNYTERLQFTFQAVNIIIAEYLMRLQFKHTLPVFMSEIPLPNMVFGFAKSLMSHQSCRDIFDVRFTEDDVWLILNYLGIQCDSENATKILDMYNSDTQTTLLMCILKCLPVYHVKNLTTGHEQVDSSEDQEESSPKSSDAMINKENKSKDEAEFPEEKCKHIVYCQACQTNLQRFKNKYKRKKKSMCKMFQELKTVYEDEVDLVKDEEAMKVRRSMASFALQLQKQRVELEKSYEARQAELEHTMSQKKIFLWGLAKALRNQHKHMLRAMDDVKGEAERLFEQEDHFKSQLAEAEKTLRTRGEEMRTQISEELSILENHLTDLKKERDTINKERLELNNIKISEDHRITEISNLDSDELKKYYEQLKSDLAMLKDHLVTTKLTTKSLIERGTITELNGVLSAVGLNNSYAAERDKKPVDEIDDRIKNQVVNDLKKKNVNLTPTNLEDERSDSSETSDVPKVTSKKEEDTIHRLRQENLRLKACAKKQQNEIDSLRRACAVPPTSSPPELPPPAPLPPAVTPAHTSSQPRYFMNRVNTSATANIVNASWRKGAGEELNMFIDAPPRIIVPGDNIPFVGVVAEHRYNRRQLFNQWRNLRHRACQLSRVTKRAPVVVNDKPDNSSIESAIVKGQQASCSLNSTPPQPVSDKREPDKEIVVESSRNREKSPKSVLREAKQKLRNVKESRASSRSKSPNSVLREAKQRLRKLAIEAEAVEMSYLDFKRKQSQLRIASNNNVYLEESTKRNIERSLCPDKKPSLQKLEENNENENDTNLHKTFATDFDKYLREYQTKIDFRETNIKTQPASDILKPVLEVNHKTNSEKPETRSENFLETPLSEFRKFYISGKRTINENNENKTIDTPNSTKTVERIVESYSTQNSVNMDSRTNRKKAYELDILKRNMNKLYNGNRDAEKQINVMVSPSSIENKLRVEVETVSSFNGDTLCSEHVIDTNVSISQTQSPVVGPITIIVSPRGRGSKHEEICNVISPRNNNRKKSLDNSLRQDSWMTEQTSDSFGITSARDNSQPVVDNEKILNILSPQDKNGDKKLQNKNGEASDFIGDMKRFSHRSCSPKSIIYNVPDGNPNNFVHNDDIKDSVLSDTEKKDDYPDDFSADVDNYNSRSESLQSPISLVKTSEDENFWDI